MGEQVQVDYVITVTLLEIYCEKFVDLLSSVPVAEQKCGLKGGHLHGLETRYCWPFVYFFPQAAWCALIIVRVKEAVQQLRIILH